MDSYSKYFENLKKKAKLIDETLDELKDKWSYPSHALKCCGQEPDKAKACVDSIYSSLVDKRKETEEFVDIATESMEKAVQHLKEMQLSIEDLEGNVQEIKSVLVEHNYVPLDEINSNIREIHSPILDASANNINEESRICSDISITRSNYSLDVCNSNDRILSVKNHLKTLKILDEPIYSPQYYRKKKI